MYLYLIEKLYLTPTLETGIGRGLDRPSTLLTLDRPELDKRKLSVKIGILPLPQVDIPIMDKADVT